MLKSISELTNISLNFKENMKLFLPKNDKSITMFTTQWCGYCINLKLQLKSISIPYHEIDIEKNKDALTYLLNLTKGQQTVPTIVFYDESYMINPSIQDIKHKINK